MARPLPAKPKKMRTQENAAIGAPGQISILLRRRRSESEWKESNDHVSFRDYYPDLDHLE
jgi:hypothetical protein